jgi:hypothetical protein
LSLGWSEVKKTGADRPLRTLAQMCEVAKDGAQAAMIPPIQALRSQRKEYLKSEGAGDVQVSGSVLLWKRFIESIAYDTAKWRKAPPFELFSVKIESDNAPPICILVCKAFHEFVVRWKRTRTSGAACCDTTWKLNVAEWGMFVIAGMATHYVPAAGHRRGMGLPFSMTFGSKEDECTLYWSMKSTFAFYEKHFGIALIPFLSVVMWDATLAGAAAHRKVLPTTDYARDLRHQLAKAKETAPSKCEGDAETKGCNVPNLVKPKKQLNN